MKRFVEPISVIFCWLHRQEPKEEKRTITIDYTPDEEESPQLVEIYIQDANNNINKVYDDFELKEKRSVELTFVINPGETAEYMVLINGVLNQRDKIPYPEQ